MKILIYLLKYGLPFLMFTDLASDIFDNSFLLNLGRGIRMVMLLFLLLENIRFYSSIKDFYFFRFNLLFAFILFLYVFTDQNVLEGLWLYFKTLFWVLGLNVLFVYMNRGYFNPEDLFKILKWNIIIASGFSMYFVVNQAGDDYNLAAYTVLFMFPALLYFSEGFRKNKLLLLLASLAIVITLKRGAILAFALSSLVYFLYSNAQSLNIRTFMTGLLFLALIIFSGYFFFQQEKDLHKDRFTIEQFDIKNERAGSGRVGLYIQLYKAWKVSDGPTKIFGFGNQEDSRRNPSSRIHAHSDVLGFLYNFGIVGILLIAFLYVKVLRFYSKIRKESKALRIYVLIAFLILVMVNFYSGLFRTQDAFYLFAVFPLVQSQIE